jgi:hypothetical protein
MVRLHSRVVHGQGAILPPRKTADKAEEEDLMSIDRLNPDLLSAEGQLLVYAPPILIGFLGAPLALADSQPKRRLKGAAKKNWAKRRAYGA